MKALVTGSDGFIGRHLCRMLREDGHEVVTMDKKSGEDVVVCVLPYGMDRVFHLAAQTDARCKDALIDARDNVMSAVRVMQRYGDKVVFSSSSAVNSLISPYSISKLAGEHYAKLFGSGVVRFCNIYGSGGRSFFDKFKDKEFVDANLPGDQLRTYAHVDAACEALLCCKPGEMKILEGDDLTVKEITQTVYSGKIVRWNSPNKYDVIDGRQVYASNN